MSLCLLHLNLKDLPPAFSRCLVDLPCTLALHLLNELGCKEALIIEMTSASANPNCISMASKGVLSSHAISMILSVSTCDS